MSIMTDYKLRWIGGRGGYVQVKDRGSVIKIYGFGVSELLKLEN